MAEDTEDPNDSSIDFSDAVFTYDTEGGFITVMPEFKPGPEVTGRHLVIHVTPEHGTATFYIELNKDACWTSSSKPPFISDEEVKAIGNVMEQRDC